MSNTKKINILCLFLSIATFFSCGNATEPDINNYPIPEYDIEIAYLHFKKVIVERDILYGKIVEYVNSYPITECVVGDTLAFSCGIEDYWLKDGMPKSIIARITTSKGDIELVKLIENTDIGYSGEWPLPCNFITYLPTERMYKKLPKQFLHYHNLQTKITSKCNPRNGILSISPDGDILTAEIITKNKILTTTLNVRSK